MLKIFKEGQKSNETFLKTLHSYYEDLMLPHFDSCKTVEEFEAAHKQVKSIVIRDLPQIWKVYTDSKSQVPSHLSEEANAFINHSFGELREHFLYSKRDFLTSFAANSVRQTQLDEPSNSSATTKKMGNKKAEQDLDDAQQKTQSMDYNKKNPAIGIDLGTTMCCVAIYDGKQIKIIPNRAQGSFTTTPSVVSYFDDESDTFGYVAKEQAYKYPETTIYDTKRMIGRKWDDTDLQNDMKHWPFEIVNVKSNPMIRTFRQNRYPQEVSARLLAQFRVMAEEFLALPIGSITKAVITVPAYFTEPQRRATCEAAQIAGLDVLNILSEPTAAAIAYSLEKRDEKKSRVALIYDLGGGTFDVSIARVKSNNKLEILAVDGDTHLGGQDIDQLLMDYCIQEFKSSEGIDLLEGRNSPEKTVKDRIRSALSRLREKCENAKVRLTCSKKTEVDVERIYEDKHMGIVITREKLEELVKPEIDKTLVILDRVLGEVKTKNVRGKEEIDDIILVGGTTRMPIVEKMLKEYFPKKTLCKDINPDEAVAYGAAIQAFNLNNPDLPKPIQVSDVTPMTLGINSVGDRFARIIHRNTSIPCKGVSNRVTVKDNQTRIKFTVYQGENDIASSNRYLGEFILEGLTPKPAREEKAKVFMSIDKNGILDVHAVCMSTGSENRITIESDRWAISKDEIEKLQAKVQNMAISHLSN